jgi:hypothetical protein
MAAEIEKIKAVFKWVSDGRPSRNVTFIAEALILVAALCGTVAGPNVRASDAERQISALQATNKQAKRSCR